MGRREIALRSNGGPRTRPSASANACRRGFAKPVPLARREALLGVPFRNAAGKKGFEVLAHKRVGEKSALGLQQLGKVGTARRRLGPEAS
jgi:hypothetical protein